MIRCYNCGGVGHRTQTCPRHGPYYPEPGKTRQDYNEQVQHIANLFARDIIMEHEGVDIEGSDEEKEHGNAQRPATARRRARATDAAGEQGEGRPRPQAARRGTSVES